MSIFYYLIDLIFFILYNLVKGSDYVAKKIEQNVVDYLEGEVLKLNEELLKLENEFKQKIEEFTKIIDTLHSLDPKYNEMIYNREYYYIMYKAIQDLLLRRINEVSLIYTMSEEEVRYLTGDMESDVNALKKQLYKSICDVAQKNIQFGADFEIYANYQFRDFELNIKNALFYEDDKIAKAINKIILDYDAMQKLVNIITKAKKKNYYDRNDEITQIKEILGSDLEDEDIYSLFSEPYISVSEIQRIVTSKYIPTFVLGRLNAAQMRADENKNIKNNNVSR